MLLRILPKKTTTASKLQWTSAPIRSDGIAFRVDGIPGFARSCSRKETFFGLANPIVRLNPSYWIQEQPVWLVEKKSRGMSQSRKRDRDWSTCGSMR